MLKRTKRLYIGSIGIMMLMAGMAVFIGTCLIVAITRTEYTWWMPVMLSASLFIVMGFGITAFAHAIKVS